MDRKYLKILLLFAMPLIGIIIFVLIALNTPSRGFVGIENYIRLFLNDSIFLKSLRNTFIIPFAAAGAMSLVSLFIRYLFYKASRDYDFIYYLVLLVWLCLLFYGISCVFMRSFSFSPLSFLFSVLAGTIWCFISWLADILIIKKIAAKKKMVREETAKI